MIGKTVGHFRITEKLGAGGMGEVYAAEDSHLGRVVALKFLPEQASANRQAIERFLREARAASSLNHPNICTIHDLGEHEGRQFIVMERLKGRTIARQTEGRPWPTDRLLESAIQLADALEAAHAQGIVHRDIKPANLFITERGDTKILDFGLAKLTHETSTRADPDDDNATLIKPPNLTRTGVAIGTTSYMSPEQARGEPVDHRTDIFSLGAVLYVMATGRDPFTGSSDAVIFEGILNRAPPEPTRINPEMPDELNRIIGCCLEKDRELRYQSAGDLRAALKRLRRDTVSGSSAEQLPTQTGDTRPAPTPEAERSGDPTASSSASASEIIHHHKKGLLISLAAIVVAIVGLAWVLAPYLTSSPTASTPGTAEAVGPGIDSEIAEGDAGRSGDLPQPPGDSLPRLAVLPFEIVGTAPDAEYLADEIPASIIDSMATLSGLTVVPRSSAFRHRDSTEDDIAIGRALDADYVLTGQITARSGTMRIRAELIDVATNTQPWSDKFDQPLDDTLAVETEITRRLTDALRLQITGEEQAALARRRPVNAEAHAAYLEGRFWWNKRTSDSLKRALELFEKAAEIDPNYALAYTGKAETYVMMANYSHPPQEVIPLAEQALQRAMELNPMLPGTHTALGWMQGLYRWDWQAAEASFLAALELDPNYATAHNFYGDLLINIGRFDEAVTHKKMVLEIDPGSLVGRSDLGYLYNTRRQFDKAIEYAQATIIMDPTFAPAYLTLGNSYVGLRRYDDAIEAYTRANELAPGGRHLGNLGYALGLGGRRAEAIAILDTMTELARHEHISASAFVLVHIGLGNRDLAFEYFDQAIEDHDPALTYCKFTLIFDPLRSDPRFDELLKRVGFPEDPPAPVVEPWEIPVPVIAVLPFEMTGVDADAAYLADEIPASVIDSLSNISFLHVIPRSSSFRLRGSTDTIPEIGEALKADFVLTGQVVTRGDEVRIRAELVAIDTNKQLFGNQIDQSSDDTLAAETEVVDRIIDTLKLPVTSEERLRLDRRRPVNPEAHAAYLEGRFWWNKRTPEGLLRAIELYERAAQIDPQYALAYAGQAETYWIMGGYSFGPHDVHPKLLPAVNRAIELDPLLAAPHAVLGMYHARYKYDWVAAEAAFLKAIELDPTYSTGHHWYGFYLLYQGRFDEAKIHMARAVKLEPSSMIIQLDSVVPFLYARQFQEALHKFEAARKMDPNFASINFFVAHALMGLGRIDEAIEQLKLGEGGDDVAAFWLGSLGQAYGMAGRREEALQELQRLITLSETRFVPLTELAKVYLGLGDLDEAFSLLNRAFDDREIGILDLKFYPAFDAARHDPRFDALLKKVGFPDDPPAPVIDP